MEEKKSLTPTNIYSLRDQARNFFSGEKILRGLFTAKTKCIAQSKNVIYTFEYPGLGSVQYDRPSIEALYRLSKRSIMDLAFIHQDESLLHVKRLHAIAALLLKCQDKIERLFKGVDVARGFSQDERFSCVFYFNPFSVVYKTDFEMILLSGKELMSLQDLGHCYTFSAVLPTLQ